jgi:hypothetical protein
MSARIPTCAAVPTLISSGRGFRSRPPHVPHVRPRLLEWRELWLLRLLRLEALGSSWLGDDENLVAEILRYEPDRDPFERAPDEVFNARFWEIERHYRNLTASAAQLNDLAMQSDRMLDAVDSVDGRCDWAVNFQVNCQDRVAIPIDLCKLIEAWSIPDGVCIVGGNCPHVVVEVRARWAKRTAPKFHHRTVP